MRHHRIAAVAIAGASAAVGACAASGTPDSGFGATAIAPGSTASSASSTTTEPSNALSQGGAPDAAADALPNGACAQSVAKSMISPVLLVFMFDRSGSMGDSVGDGLTKWTALIPSLEAFFADPKSAGLSASLQFFTQPDECTVSEYATPLVSMTPLPNSSLFRSAIASITPDGDTPTLPALEGAMQYATQEKMSQSGAKVAVVLVTDGEPHDDCGSTVASVAAEAQTYAATIRTYVVGIGKSLTSLDTIAQAGGTGEAFLVATANNPDAGGTASQTELDFEAALSSIRGSVSTCNLPLPSAPAGESLDFEKVNVLYTSMSGQPVTLDYNADCGGQDGGTGDGGAGEGGAATGWHYDDLQAPTTIVLCPASCNIVEGDVTAQLDIELGGVTQGIPR